MQREKGVENSNIRIKKSVLFLGVEGLKDEVGLKTWIQSDVSSPCQEKKKWNDNLHLPFRGWSPTIRLCTQRDKNGKRETRKTFLMENSCLMGRFSASEAGALSRINGNISSRTRKLDMS
jgi:hypothetical protein